MKTLRLFLCSILAGCLVYLSVLSASADSWKVGGFTNVNATTTSTRVLLNNPNRTYLLVINKGSSEIYLKVDSIHSSDEGVTILPGGSWEPPYAPIGSIWVKSSTGSQPLKITEGLRPTL